MCDGRFEITGQNHAVNPRLIQGQQIRKGRAAILAAKDGILPSQPPRTQNDYPKDFSQKKTKETKIQPPILHSLPGMSPVKKRPATSPVSRRERRRPRRLPPPLSKNCSKAPHAQGASPKCANFPRRTDAFPRCDRCSRPTLLEGSSLSRARQQSAVATTCNFRRCAPTPNPSEKTVVFHQKSV